MKKLTKKEMEIIEKEKREKTILKNNMISDLEDYWKDIEAVRRVAIINQDIEKLDYGNNLKKEEKEKLLNRYERIKDLSNTQIEVLRTLIHNRSDERRNITKEHLPANAIWTNDIIWKEENLIEYITFLKELGIEKIYYTNHSTNALEVIVWLTKAGAKVIGTTKISEYNEGVIFELN